MTYALLPLIAPVALILAALAAIRTPGMRPRGLIRLTEAAGLLALAAAVLSALALMVWGPATSPLIGAGGVGLSARLDAVSVTMLTLVSFIGWIVLRYSGTYLDGEARQGAELQGMAGTAGLGRARRGKSGRGMAGMAGKGEACRGGARQGRQARHGVAGQGSAGRGRQPRISSCARAC